MGPPVPSHGRARWPHGNRLRRRCDRADCLRSDDRPSDDDGDAGGCRDGTILDRTVFWSLPTAMLSGTAAAGGIALINALGNLGGFFGPYVFGLVRDATGQFHDGPDRDRGRPESVGDPRTVARPRSSPRTSPDPAGRHALTRDNHKLSDQVMQPDAVPEQSSGLRNMAGQFRLNLPSGRSGP